MKLLNKMIMFSVLLVLTGTGCSKRELELNNPNAPEPFVLTSEEGMMRAGLGIYNKFGLEFWWLAMSGHNAMGDMTNMSVGNFSWRWMNQAERIILSDGTVLLPPQGQTQGFELKARNDRSFGTDNPFYPEWLALYLVNNQANIILEAVNSPQVNFAGDATTVESKKNVMRAWAYWWKGFVYSRIGSLYVAGIVTDEVNVTNPEFRNRTAVIAEAHANFDKATAALNAITVPAVYTTMMTRMIPSFARPAGTVRAWNQGGVPTIDAFKRIMNTYKARNILVNKRPADITNAEWTEILALTQDGVQPGDRVFALRTADQNDLVSRTAWTPFRLLAFPWELLSERWVQEFKPGDARRTRNVIPYAQPQVNVQGRGFLYGTRWTLRPIESGGDYASTQSGLAEVAFVPTYEENALTRAEALIRTGAIEPGLQLIDAVRQYQNAQLPAVAGTGLTQAQALDELYRERRIALFLKGTAFYDYRRFGFACKDCQRTGAVVLGPGAVVDNNATIVYNYMDYWDVPMNELDFNEPSSTSAPVTFPY